MGDTTIRILTWGGIGDTLLVTPALRALKEQQPARRVVVACAHADHLAVLRHNPHIDALMPPAPWRNVRRWMQARLMGREYRQLAYSIMAPSLFYTTNATHALAEMLGVTLTSERMEVFLSPAEHARARARLAPYDSAVVIHVTSKTSANQNWPMEQWAALVRRNPQHQFLQIGLASEAPVAGAVDLRGQTTIRDAFALLQHSRAFIGVVSAFSHAAAAVNTPAVVLFGASTPVVWGHAHAINLYKGLPCAPCIEILSYDPCPYGSACMRAITVDEVEHALRQQLTPREGLGARVAARA